MDFVRRREIGGERVVGGRRRFCKILYEIEREGERCFGKGKREREKHRRERKREA